jgi:hypothetical protein
MKLLLLALAGAFLFSSEEIKLEGAAIFKSHTLQNVDVYHTPQGFKISKDGMMHFVQKYNTDPKLRTITQKNLFEFLQNGGYIDCTKVGDEYKITAKVRGNGGFLLTGVIVYQTCRVVGHATVWTAAGVSIAGAFVAAGPAGAGAAYLNALATVPTAITVVESASLTIGTAASWIPGLP